MAETTGHYHVWVMIREHGIHAFGVDPVLRRLPTCYEGRQQANRALRRPS